MGMDHTRMTMVFAISPFLGFFLSPVFGSISDRCKSRFGRRRPMIVFLSIGAVTGWFLQFAAYRKIKEISFSGLLSIVVGKAFFNLHQEELQIINATIANVTEANGAPVADSGSNMLIYAIGVAILGTLLTEFNADMSQLASRTYMLDICLPQDHAKTLSLFSMMAGVGGILGFAFGTIDWDSTIFANVLGDNIQTVFNLVAIIYVVTEIITITSFREIPLKMIEADEMLQPITQKVVAMEMKNRNLPEALVEAKKEDEEPAETKHLSAITFIKSMVFLPTALKILCLANCFAWSGHIVYCLFFNDFVGESLFHGDPQAHPGTELFERYYEGVRFANRGRVIYALTCIVFSMAIEKLMKVFSTKIVFISSMLSFAFGMAFLGKFRCLLLWF